MTVSTSIERLSDGRALLAGLDRLRRDIDRSGLIEGMDTFGRPISMLRNGQPINELF